MKTKHFFTALTMMLALGLISPLSACGGDDDPVEEPQPEQPSTPVTPADTTKTEPEKPDTTATEKPDTAIIEPAAPTRFVGGDVSMLPQYEAQGARYLDKNGAAIADLIAFLKQQGWNSLRVRLFVDPSRDSDKGVCQDLDYVKRLGRRVKEVGMQFVLDFHYSDTWADPAKQWTPASWLSLSDSELQQRLYDYTRDCLQQLVAAGATPDFIQTGNEISYGMLWGATGSQANRCYSGNDANWPRFKSLLAQAARACREVCPQARIILHTERVAQPSVLQNFYNQMAQQDYDVIGLSYYPYFHGRLDVLQTALQRLETAFPTKEIQVVEAGYPNKWAVPGTEIDYTSTYPYSPEGQRQFTAALVALLRQHQKVTALYWWYPEANAHGCTGNLSRDWYNAPLFDNESGRALPALYELEAFL